MVIFMTNKDYQELNEKINGNIPNPSSGVVGQILEVETVDDNGKPLTYRLVDKPEALPVVTSEDNGKSLQVVDGVWVAVTVEDEECKLPGVTTEDNGKLLGVVDGAWAAVSITDGNEVAY